MTVALAVTVALFVACGKDDGGETPPPAAPAITLKEGDIKQTQEIAAAMSVTVQVAAPGSISDFTIRIESPALTPETLADFKLAQEMNLVTPATDEMAQALKGLHFPVGADVKGKQSLSFNLSDLIPMIALIYDQTSDHVFTLTVTDAKNQRTSEALKFHLTGESAVAYNNDADLWANTASFRVKLPEAASDVKFEYKRSTATDWQQATVTPDADGTYKAAVAPKWVAAPDHASGAKLFTLDAAEGVFAGVKYDYRVVVDGQPIEKLAGTFDAPAGQAIPGGNMETWSEEETDGLMGKVNLYNPTKADGTPFWGNGCNAFTPTLCLPDTVAVGSNHAAKLQGGGFGTIFAAGNLFTGVFEMAGMAGYARFGAEYEFKARPRAIRVLCKAVIDSVTMLNPSADFKNPEGVEVGKTDPARVFVCITDWTDRHSVYSGLGVKDTEINAFDPEKTLAPAEGVVLAYGSKTIMKSIDEWQEIQIPILWADKDAKPQPSTTQAVRYSLVISSAASAYGDFLCGCKENILYLDDFEWVY